MSSIGGFTDDCVECHLMTANQVMLCTLCRQDVCVPHLPAHYRACREKIEMHNRAHKLASDLDEE